MKKFLLLIFCATIGHTAAFGQGNVMIANPASRPVPVDIISGGTGGGAATVADGADVTQGAKADAKSTATDTTPISIVSILKQISASAQAPPSQAVTNAGTFAVQAAATQSGTWTVQPGNTANTTAWKVDGSAVTQPANVSQVNGTTTDTNSGVKSAGTLRVVLATDQPALTNKLLVTPDSVALPANQSVNVAQVNGVTPLMGAGNTGTGSPRVTIASDQAVISTKRLVASSTNGQVTASGSAATLVAANAARSKLTIRNQDTSLSVYVGEATVTSGNGLLLKAGESRVFETPELMQVIAPSGSPVVDYIDESY